MHKKLRLRILLALVLCFVIGAPLIILWAKGYRFDYGERAIVRVGAIFVNTRGVDADLEISGLYTRTISHSIFSNGILIKNLLPKTYTVYVKKEGYITWSKILEVKPLEVSSESHVVLLPEVPVVSPLLAATGTPMGIWDVPGGNEMILGTASNGQLVMRLAALSGDPSKIVSAPAALTLPVSGLGGSKIVSISLSADRTNALVGLDDGTILLYRNSSKRTMAFGAYLRALSASALPQLNLMWHPTDGSRLFGISQNGRIYYLDLQKNTYERIQLPGIVAMDEQNKYILLQNGDVMRPSNGGFDKVATISLPSSLRSVGPGQLFPLASRSYILRFSAGETWLLAANKLPQFIAPKTNFIVPNRDGNRVAIFSADQILSVLFINETSDDVYFAPASQIKLGLADQDLKNIYWFGDDWHLTLRYPDKFEVMEIDNRSPINRIAYPITNEGAVFRSFNDTILYVSRGSLWTLKLAN